MSGIDGLELVKKTKKVKDEVKVIVLSGFDDFSYAQTAVKQGAFDYLQKTADIDKLLSVIKKAIKIINENRKKKELDIKLKKQLNMSLPLLRYKYLNQLIYGCTEIDVLIKCMNFVDLKLNNTCFILAVAEIDDFALLSEKMTEEEQLLLKLRVLNLLDELLGEDAIYFESKYEEVVWIYFCDSELTENENKKSLC